MERFYILVFGTNPSEQIKKFKDQLIDPKEANWMYQNILGEDDLTHEKLLTAIFSNPKLVPQAIIDNGKLISKEQFGFTEATWKTNLEKFVMMCDLGASIVCFSVIRKS